MLSSAIKWFKLSIHPGIPGNTHHFHALLVSIPLVSMCHHSWCNSTAFTLSAMLPCVPYNYIHNITQKITVHKGKPNHRQLAPTVCVRFHSQSFWAYLLLRQSIYLAPVLCLKLCPNVSEIGLIGFTRSRFCITNLLPSWLCCACRNLIL